MKLTYLNTEKNAVFTRFDDCQNAIQLMLERNIKELHIQANIAGVAALFSTEKEIITEPKRNTNILDLSLIAHFSQLECLYIYPSDDIYIINISALYTLKNLEYLDFQFFTNWENLTEDKLDLRELQKIKYFSSIWNKNIINLAQAISLEKLQIRHYPKLDCQEFKELVNLKYLQLMETKIKNLGGIEKLQQLDTLIIGHCRALENIDNINGCTCLEYFHIEKCPKLLDINISSHSLKKIILDKVLNLNFLYNCPNIQRLSFTDVKNGNMQPIIDKKIKETFFYPAKRPHYQYSEKELHRLLADK